MDAIESPHPGGLSLRSRLNLMIVLTMLAIMGMDSLFIIHNARRSVLEEVQSSVRLALQLIEAGLERTSGDEPLRTAWLADLSRLDNMRHLRIHLMEQPERVFNLKADETTSEDLRAPPWFNWLVAPERIVGEKQVERIAGQPIRILIEANPNDEIAEAWSEAEDFIVLMLVLAVSVYVLVHFTLGRAFKSVGIILKGLDGIEHGDYEKRLPQFHLPEFDRISRAFNHMAQSLATARDRNQSLAQHSLTIQEEERRSLSRELHDELGQSLSAIKAMAASLRKPLEGGRGSEAVASIIDVCDRLFGVVRGIMRRLHPTLLDELGLVASLQDLAENWRDHNPDVRLELSCDESVDEYAGSSRIHLFRIAQECLTNVVRHAQATVVRVRLSLRQIESQAWMVLEVSDNGRGFDPDRPKAGFGLLGMRERAASLGGVFSLETRPSGGVSIEVSVPCIRATKS